MIIFMINTNDKKSTNISTFWRSFSSVKNRQSRTTCSYFCRREIKTETVWNATLTRQKKITYALAFRALLFLVLIDVGGYVRSPIPAAQDLRVLVDSHLMLSKHVKVHMTRNFFDCFGIIIV